MTEPAETADPAFEALLGYLREHRGFDFTGYKPTTLLRRIEKRMQAVGAKDLAEYQAYLEAQPDEFTDLFNTILINVTSFFRDPEAWDYVAAELVPRILEGKGPGDAVRVWSAGAAAGQEAFSIAILLCEAMGEDEMRSRVKIYATDVDEPALSQGRHAVYTPSELQPAVSDERLERFFERSGEGRAFRADLRRAVIFGHHDLMRHPPISRVDLLLCRNTLMYFTTDAQRRILAGFHFALNPGGILFLGKGEAIASRSELFEPLDHRWHVFTRSDRVAPPRPPLPAAPTRRQPEPGDRELLHRSGFEAAPVAQLVVDGHGILVLANTRARVMFGLGVGQIGRPLKDLELSYRPVELRSAIDEVMTKGSALRLGEAEWRPGGEESVHLSIEVTPLRPAGTVAGVSVSFTDVTRFRLLQFDFERTQRELETAYEELQSTVEELETTNEELQSTNEELETTNEELHSSNEELETMNQELQSTNEELETTNRELAQRTEELDHANAFLGSILSSLDSGVVVLDREMRVREWNRATEELWGLRDGEVQGEHFLNLDVGLPVEQLRQPIKAVFAGDAVDDHVLDCVNRRGRTVRCRVSVAPLRSNGDDIQGVILLMEQEPG
jgi:two-component system, chemotaxis family, CheB/CheR fusion protein